MAFNTLIFYLFFLVFLLIYWRLDYSKQNLLLLIGSYLFYSYLNWRLLFLILIPTVVDFFCGLKIHQAQSKQKKTIFLWASIFTNLSILFVFKYYNFFIDNLSSFLGKIGINIISPLHLNIIAPIGISYYLFKSMTYTIDIYRKVIKEPTGSYLNYAVYLSFFPQILAGPIERAANFLPQISNARRFNWEFFKLSCYLIFWGLFKKCFIADNLAPLVKNVFSQSHPNSGFEILLGTYAATFQLYADFSGYSDLAIGIAGCLGFKTLLNFNLPFFANSPTDIWHRWHISLSSWCRDYVFYYLNRARLKITGAAGKGTSAVVIATMTIMGLWHGAAWPFILWGTYHGILISIQNLTKPLYNNSKFNFSPKIRPLINAFKILFVFHLFVFGEFLFYGKSVTQILNFLRTLVFQFNITQQSLFLLGAIVFYIWILVALELIQYIKNDHFIVLKWNFWARTFIYFTLLVLLSIFGVTGAKPFIYTNF